MALVGEGPRYAARLNKNHVPYGGIIITASLGLLGVLPNASCRSDANTSWTWRARHRWHLGDDPPHSGVPVQGQARRSAAS